MTWKEPTLFRYCVHSERSHASTRLLALLGQATGWMRLTPWYHSWYYPQHPTKPTQAIHPPHGLFYLLPYHSPLKATWKLARTQQGSQGRYKVVLERISAGPYLKPSLYLQSHPIVKLQHHLQSQIARRTAKQRCLRHRTTLVAEPVMEATLTRPAVPTLR